MPKEPRSRYYTPSVDRDPLLPSASTSTANSKSKRAKSKSQRAPPPIHSPSHFEPSSFQSFNPSSQTWSPSALNSFPINPSRIVNLKCLTYNTFSSSPSHNHYQTLALLEILKSSECDVIALQEVSQSFEKSLKEESYFKTGFSMTSWKDYTRIAGKGTGGRGKPGSVEGVMILVRKELIGRGSSCGVVKLNVAQGEGGKGLVIVKLFSGQQEVLRLVSTLLLSNSFLQVNRSKQKNSLLFFLYYNIQISSHFTSLPSEENALLRHIQYTTALHHLQSPATTRTILLADFNNSDEQELLPFSSLLIDAHHSSSTDLFHASPTFGELYPFYPHTKHLKVPKRRKLKRVDRVLFNGFTSCESYETVGERPLFKNGGTVKLKDREGLDGGVYASDHLGVLVMLN